jgi:hypothetical protein
VPEREQHDPGREGEGERDEVEDPRVTVLGQSVVEERDRDQRSGGEVDDDERAEGAGEPGRGEEEPLECGPERAERRPLGQAG